MRNRPSGDHDCGRSSSAEARSCFSSTAPFMGLTDALNAPLRLEENATCEPSGDQAGVEFIPLPKVKREWTLLRRSKIQIVDPPLSKSGSAAASFCPSGESRR